MLVAGRVGRPHGLDGSFHVVEPRASLLGASSVTVGDRTLRVVRRAGTDARPIVRLEGVSDRSAAESLRGADLLVERASAPSLGDDEWYASDLEGCLVADGARELGRVRRLVALPSCEALEIDDGFLVPLVADAVRAVDIEGRRIDVDTAFLGV